MKSLNTTRSATTEIGNLGLAGQVGLWLLVMAASGSLANLEHPWLSLESKAINNIMQHQKSQIMVKPSRETVYSVITCFNAMKVEKKIFTHTTLTLTSKALRRRSRPGKPVTCQCGEPE
ncbi:hypothetical protein PoB_003051300 [Plakobranchus ocellatus]|uniref:Uncharacterized protein n=1 Tax=Plakobranchus ocellatus TaxID=259542 RepID=A0AAV4AB75_9GAST|nr:hypothetical protein PoB_003051300 [Plakobranchus ocellatus]